MLVSGCYGQGAYDSLLLDKIWAKGLVNLPSPIQGSATEGHLISVLNNHLKGTRMLIFKHSILKLSVINLTIVSVLEFLMNE